MPPLPERKPIRRIRLGHLGGPSAGDRDTFVAKYNATGDLLWTLQLGTSGWDGALGISVDVLGNVYIGGGTDGDLGGPNAGDFDAFLVKLTPPLAPPTLPGDYNNNGLVDQADLDLVLLNWGQELTDPAALGWLIDPPAGIVNQQHLDAVLLGWGNTAALGSSTAAGVPEPSSWALLAIALTLVAATGVRHAGRCRRP